MSYSVALSGLGGDESTATSLLRRVKARDPVAWDRLLRLYGPLVYRWCRQSGVGAADASDLAQEVFVTVWARVGAFEREGPGSFRGWLRAIVWNKLGDLIRRQQRGPRAEGGTAAHQRLQEAAEPVQPAPPSSAPHQEREAVHLAHAAVELVRAEFEDRTWRAFYQVAVEGRLPADVADELGMSRAAVYQSKTRVLRRLREELAET